MTEPWTPERAWTADEVRSVIKTSWPALKASRVKPFGSGWDNAAFLIDERIVFRFAQRRIAIPLLEREWSVLPKLSASLRVPIPSPQWFGHVDRWPFLGYPKLDGQPAADLGLSPTIRSSLAGALGLFLRELHDQPISEFAIDPETLGRFNLSLQTTRAEAMLAECEDGIDTQALRQVLDDVHPDPGRIVISHGDLYSRHLLLEQGRVSGVIDWGDVCLSDEAHDLMLVFGFLPPEARPAFFKEYGAISASTSSRARFRAVVHTLHVYRYARAIGDAALLAEAITSFRNAAG